MRRYRRWPATSCCESRLLAGCLLHAAHICAAAHAAARHAHAASKLSCPCPLNLHNLLTQQPSCPASHTCCSAAGGHGYTLLLECAQLLLGLGSSALYSPSARGQLGQHPFLDAMMQQRDLANPSERGFGGAYAVSAVSEAGCWAGFKPSNGLAIQSMTATAAAVHFCPPLLLPPHCSRGGPAALLHCCPRGTAQREDCAVHANRHALGPEDRAHCGR